MMEPILPIVWIVFDLSNGNPKSKRYCWYFETRKLARDHIKWQKSQPHSATLSKPYKFQWRP